MLKLQKTDEDIYLNVVWVCVEIAHRLTSGKVRCVADIKGMTTVKEMRFIWKLRGLKFSWPFTVLNDITRELQLQLALNLSPSLPIPPPNTHILTYQARSICCFVSLCVDIFLT